MALQATALSPARVSEKTEVDAIYRKINWRIVPIILFPTSWRSSTASTSVLPNFR